MALNIEEIRDTLNLNREDIVNNRELTNEYIVEDLMIELGYNKRKNKAVKETIGEPLSWKVYDKNTSEEALLAVKVFGVDEAMDNDELNEALKNAHEGNFKILIVTNGECIRVYRLFDEEKSVNVCEIDINNELTEAQNIIMDAISENGFNLEVIDNSISSISITEDEILDIAKNNCDKLAKVIADIKEINDDTVVSFIGKTLKEKLCSEIVDSRTGEVDQEAIRSFRKQIEELTYRCSEAEDALRVAQEEIKKKDDQINNISGTEEKRAKDLLSVIVDNPELDRSYVAVINKELIQYGDIHTFAGRAFQKLYEIKHYEASQYIFNSESIKLITPAVRGDLLMANKTYDVNLNTDNEDEALNKIRVLFSHFSDIIFECKKVGTLREETKAVENVAKVSLNKEEANSLDTEDEAVANEVENIDIEEDDTAEFEAQLQEDVMKSLGFGDDNTEESDIDASEDDFSTGEESEVSFDEDSEETANFDDISLDESDFEDGEFEEGISEDNFDTADFGEETVEGNFDTFENVDDIPSDDAEISTSKSPVLICAQLPQLNSILWANEDIDFGVVKYIGSSSINLNINSNYDDMTNEQVLVKCIDAVMALAEVNSDSDVIKRLRGTDLSTISNFIRLYTTEYADCTRINGTRYVVTGIENTQQLASALVDICDALNIDTSDMFIFIQAETSSESIIEDWGYEEKSIQTRDIYEFNGDTSEKVIAILKGDIFSNIMITKNSLSMLRNTIGTTMAVKTNYMKGVIRPENKDDDFSEIIKKIICEATKNVGIENIRLESVGNVIGESYKFISTDESAVKSECIQINANGLICYVSLVEDWQIPLSILKTHNTLLNDTQIIIKTQISSSAMDFYNKEFESSEPSFTLAVKSMANYINGCIKQ